MSNNVQQFPVECSDNSSTRAGGTLPSDSRLTLQSILDLAQQILNAPDSPDVPMWAAGIRGSAEELLSVMDQRDAEVYEWASGQ